MQIVDIFLIIFIILTGMSLVLILLIAFFRGFSALKNKTSILTIIILGFSLIGFTGIAINNAIMPEFKKRDDLTFNDYKYESYLNKLKKIGDEDNFLEYLLSGKLPEFYPIDIFILKGEHYYIGSNYIFYLNVYSNVDYSNFDLCLYGITLNVRGSREGAVYGCSLSLDKLIEGNFTLNLKTKEIELGEATKKISLSDFNYLVSLNTDSEEVGLSILMLTNYGFYPLLKMKDEDSSIVYDYKVDLYAGGSIIIDSAEINPTYNDVTYQIPEGYKGQFDNMMSSLPIDYYQENDELKLSKSFGLKESFRSPFMIQKKIIEFSFAGKSGNFDISTLNNLFIEITFKFQFNNTKLTYFDNVVCGEIIELASMDKFIRFSDLNRTITYLN